MLLLNSNMASYISGQAMNVDFCMSNAFNFGLAAHKKPGEA
jgi:hypothetical protein